MTEGDVTGSRARTRADPGIAKAPSGSPRPGERDRLIAWATELRRVHERLRAALRVAQGAAAARQFAESATRELLLYCRGFCAALTGHHEGEDRSLFPAIEAAHPDLRDTLRRLEQDHSMIEYLITGLKASLTETASTDDLRLHLEGIAAIMESHFAYEERQLLEVLNTLDLEADPTHVLGAFAR